jgi:hypothetical protein
MLDVRITGITERTVAAVTERIALPDAGWRRRGWTLDIDEALCSPSGALSSAAARVPAPAKASATSAASALATASFVFLTLETLPAARAQYQGAQQGAPDQAETHTAPAHDRCQG